MSALYQELASAVGAYHRCVESGNAEWESNHNEAIHKLELELPSGSGFDSGTKVALYDSTEEKLVLQTCFHHMNENGMYAGWTDHTVIVTASLVFGIKLRITGRNRNEIKHYIHEVFETALLETFKESKAETKPTQG